MKFRLVAIIPIAALSTSLFAYTQIPDVSIQSKLSTSQKNKRLKTTLPMQVLTQKQEDILHANTVSELLEQSTSLVTQNSDGTEAHASLSMRGFGDNAAENSLILINGQPLTNPDISAPDLNLLPISNVSRIEILQNSQSILYGDQAVGGVMNIITKSPTHPVKKINLNYGSFATRNAQGELGDSFKNGFGYDLNLGHFASNHYRAHNFEQKNHAMIDLNYHNDKTQSYLDVENINQHLQLPGALTRAQLNQDREQAKNHNDESNFNNLLSLFGFNQLLTSDWYFKTDGSAMNGSGDGVIALSNIPYSFDNKRKNFFIRPELSGTMPISSLKIKPTFGAEFKNSQYTYKSTVYGSEDTQNQIAAFGDLTIPYKKIELNAGERVAKSADEINTNNTKTSNHDHLFISSLGFTYHFTQAWQAYLRRAGNYRFPKVDENTNTQNNQPLKTQTGVSYETGLLWQTKKISILASLYQLDLKNEILYVPLINSASGFGFNQNLSRTRRRGFNLTSAYSIVENWKVNFNYQYVQSKFMTGSYKGKEIPNVPTQTLNLGTTIYFLICWSYFINGEYIGTHYANNDVNNIQLLGGYTTLNTGIGYRIKYFNISLKINNLLNRQYNAATVMDNATTSYYYPAPGINGSINLEASF